MSEAERYMAHFLRNILTSAIGPLVVGLSQKIYPRDIKNWVDVNPVHLTLPRLDREFHNYRLVQISDFHIGTWINRSRLEEAVALVNRQRPDLVAITGDFVTFEPEKFAPDLIAALSKLSARDGVLAVFGNHDHWTDIQVVREITARAGITDLSNAVHTLRRGEAELHLAGVDDYMDNLDRLDLVLDKLPETGAAILLAHEPDFADVSASCGRFDLQISGHSHGGQIMLPRIGAPFLPSYARKYPSGLYRVGEMLQYTNRGLGTAELQIRINCRAEITVFTLQSPACTA